MAADNRTRKQDNANDDRGGPPAPERQAKIAWPTIFGIAVAIVVLVACAGATVFFLTHTASNRRLVQEGEQQLANGQYAFAVKTLSEAAAKKPNDAKVFLALAQAYVGVDQVDKAWDCISHAQMLGLGVAANPELASQLANYYRQHDNCERALDLLRPLAAANVPGKRAELADLDALWGDELLRGGKTEQALRCWEEVSDLRDGSRWSEAAPRLATIYQRLANNSAAKNDDSNALTYLNKLNSIAENYKSYEMAADIYKRDGKLDQAIEQIRKAISLAGKNPALDQKLALLLTERGKELLDQGMTDSGYGYLQQAQELNPNGPNLLKVTLRNVTVIPEQNAHGPKIVGEVWNPSDKALDSLNIKAELVDSLDDRILWSQDQQLVDQFVSPVAPHQSVPFEFTAPLAPKSGRKTEFRVYLDNALYSSYRYKNEDASSLTAKSDAAGASREVQTSAGKDAIALPPSAGSQATDAEHQSSAAAMPKPLAANSRPEAIAPSSSFSSTPPLEHTVEKSDTTVEEKTMKDLEY